MEVVALALVCLLAVWLENVLYRKNAFKGLSYRCYLSRSQVFEGEEIELIEEIENRKWLPLLGLNRRSPFHAGWNLPEPSPSLPTASASFPVFSC